MNWRQVYSKHALEDLRHLPEQISQRIVDKIKFYTQQENPLSFAKKLSDNKTGEYRFRIGNYRAIFETDKEGNIFILTILRIKHRKEVYKI